MGVFLVLLRGVPAPLSAGVFLVLELRGALQAGAEGVLLGVLLVGVPPTAGIHHP